MSDTSDRFTLNRLSDGHYEVVDHQYLQETASFTEQEMCRMLVFGAKAVGFLRMASRHPDPETADFASDVLALLAPASDPEPPLTTEMRMM